MLTLILYTLFTIHLGVFLTSIYLHRYLCHRQFTLNPVVVHIFRFMFWIVEGVHSKPFVAQHRKHHKHTDVHGDPHSPLFCGFWTITLHCMVPNFFKKYQYHNMTDWALEHYGAGTPDDWLERNVYVHTKAGLLVLLAINISLFGWYGILAWLIHMFGVSLFANANITGFGHWIGYRTYDLKDNSHNVFPIGILCCGEELHHNHHNDPANPNLACQWYEFDLGWWYIKLLVLLRLASLRDNSQNNL